MHLQNTLGKLQSTMQWPTNSSDDTKCTQNPLGTEYLTTVWSRLYFTSLPFLHTIETKFVPSLGQTLAHQCTSTAISSIKTRFFKEKRERDNMGWKGATKWNLFYLKESDYSTKLIPPTCWRMGKIEAIRAIWKRTSFFHLSKLGLLVSP